MLKSEASDSVLGGKGGWRRKTGSVELLHSLKTYLNVGKFKPLLVGVSKKGASPYASRLPKKRKGTKTKKKEKKYGYSSTLAILASSTYH